MSDKDLYEEYIGKWILCFDGKIRKLINVEEVYFVFATYIPESLRINENDHVRMEMICHFYHFFLVENGTILKTKDELKKAISEYEKKFDKDKEAINADKATQHKILPQA